MENAGYLFAAFGIVWAGLFGYVVLLVRRQKRLEREIDLLKKQAVTKEAGADHRGDRG